MRGEGAVLLNRKGERFVDELLPRDVVARAIYEQMEKDDIVFSSTKEGLIFALDASTGQVLWKHKIGNSLINTVLPISRHQVLFTATSGETGLLEWKK